MTRYYVGLTAGSILALGVATLARYLSDSMPGDQRSARAEKTVAATAEQIQIKTLLDRVALLDSRLEVLERINGLENNSNLPAAGLALPQFGWPNNGLGPGRIIQAGSTDRHNSPRRPPRDVNGSANKHAQSAPVK